MFFLLNDDSYLTWDEERSEWRAGHAAFDKRYPADDNGHPLRAGARMKGMLFKTQDDMNNYRQDRQMGEFREACVKLVAAREAVEEAQAAYHQAEYRFNELKGRCGVELPILVGETLIDYKGGKYVTEKLGFKVVW